MDKAAQCPCLCVWHRYFLHNWPQLAFLAYDGDHCFGTVVCKMDVHREQMLRGYLAMLVVEKPYRSLGTGVNCLLMSLSKRSQLQGICLCCERHDMHDGPEEFELPSCIYLACINGVTVLKHTDRLLQSKTCTYACNTCSSHASVFNHAGTELVKLSIAEMIKGQCEEVVLEAEVTNSGALALYQNLGFIRDKRLHRYVLHKNTASIAFGLQLSAIRSKVQDSEPCSVSGRSSLDAYNPSATRLALYVVIHTSGVLAGKCL